jgi:hypothetical protein
LTSDVAREQRRSSSLEITHADRHVDPLAALEEEVLPPGLDGVSLRRGEVVLARGHSAADVNVP